MNEVISSNTKIIDFIMNEFDKIYYKPNNKIITDDNKQKIRDFLKNQLNHMTEFTNNHFQFLKIKSNITNQTLIKFSDNLNGKISNLDKNKKDFTSLYCFNKPNSNEKISKVFISIIKRKI
jgi:hypothetical protein